MKKLMIILPAMLMASGCASMIKGSSDNITVNSLEKGTVLYVDGAARGMDNAMINVKKGKPHHIRAEKEGCQPVSTETGESFDATSLLGLLIDAGIITITTDLISGAAWKIEPTTYTLTPICKAG